MAENINSLDDKLTLKLEKVLLDAKKVSGADGATLYMLEDDGLLHFSIMVNDTLKTHMGGSSSSETDVLPLKIYDTQTGEANNNNVCTSAFANKKIINIANIHDSSNFDFSGTFMFDSKNNYKTVSILTVPLFDLRGNCIAVMQLINAKDKDGNIINFSDEIQESVNLIAGQAAVLVENSRLIQESHKLLEDFAKVFYRAIEQKSKSLAKHCEQVPVISKMLLSAACRADTGKFKDFNVSDDELHSFNLASWLNDFGELTTPDYLTDKQTKLDVFYNRIESIRLKFEILLRDARISLLEGLMLDPSKKAKLEQAYKDNIAALRDEFAFIAKCNLGDTTLTAKGLAKLDDIAKRSFTNYFDRTLGHFSKNQNADTSAKTTNLLENTSENITDTRNHSEIYSLSVKTGVLTPDEQTAINDHLENSINILKEISLPTSYQYAIDYAASQHERVDGQGYPNHLTGDKIAIPARIIALADAFEKLSSSDGKQEAKKLSQILNELYTLVKDGALDPDIFHLFLTSGVYNDYAKEYLLPEQCDDPDISQYTEGYDDNAPLTYANPYPFVAASGNQDTVGPTTSDKKDTTDSQKDIDFLAELNNFDTETKPLDMTDNAPATDAPTFSPDAPTFEPLSVSDIATKPTDETTGENKVNTEPETQLSETEITQDITPEPTLETEPPHQGEEEANTEPELDNESALPATNDDTANASPNDELDDDYGTIPNLEEDTIPEPQSEPADVAPATTPTAEPPVIQDIPTPATTPVPPPVVQETTAPTTMPPLLKDNNEEIATITPIATVEPPLLKDPQ